MLRHVWILGAAGILAVASSSVAETGSIGTVDELINIAYRQPVDQPRAQLVLADQLYQNETLETEPDASLQVTFLDGTSLRLEGSSKVVLDQYVYNPASADSAICAIRAVWVLRSRPSASSAVSLMLLA